MDDPVRTVEFDDAFADLYLRARQVTYGILGDRQTAEDAAAEALIQARRRWRRVRALPHRDAWVLRIAIDAAVEEARRRPAPGPTRTAATGRDGGATDDGPGADLVALDDGVVDRLVRLPRRQREAVVLVALLGFPPADVAAVTNESVGSVDRLVARGLERLGGHIATVAAPDGRASGALGR